MRVEVLDNLKKLYSNRGLSPGPVYTESLQRALGDQLAYGSPAMYGVTATVLSSKKMIAYNLVQNSIDEAKGAARIQMIADKYAPDPLFKKMHRHVGEELKHSRQFHDLVKSTGFETDQEPVEPEAAEEVLDFDDELTAFICRVHSIEIRSWTVLRMYQDVLQQQRFPEITSAALPVLDDIMQDEINHVFYTGQQVDEWLRDDPGLQQTLDECLEHTNRETWQDLASMTSWIANNYSGILGDSPHDVKLPESRFLVGDMAPPATLT